MHGMNGHDPSRNRRRRALEVLAVVAGGYGMYQLFRRLRATQQSADGTALPQASTPSTASMPAASMPTTSMSAARTVPSPQTSPGASSVLSPAASPSLGEHSAWLETFRAEQVQRLRSDPPAA